MNPSLARVAEILSPAGGVSPPDIIAELAVLDGLRDHEESIRLLNEVNKGSRGWLPTHRKGAVV